MNSCLETETNQAVWVPKNKDINLQMLPIYLEKSYFDKDIYIDTVSLSYLYKYDGVNYLNDKDVNLPIKELFKWLHIHRD